MPLQGEELVGSPVSVPARYAEQGCAADRFQRQLTLSVDMTSAVKGFSQLFMSSCSVPISSCCPSEEAEPVRSDG
jgi:hypothetical protein